MKLHMLESSGSIDADAIITDPTAPCYIERHDTKLTRECGLSKRDKHGLNSATMVPLIMTTCDEVDASAQVYLQKHLLV